MREHILHYLDDPDKNVRQAAALACCRVLDRHARAAAAAAAAQAAAAAARLDGSAAVERSSSSLMGPNGILALNGAAGAAAVAGVGGQVLLLGSTGAAAAAAAVGGSLGLGLRHTKMVEVAVGKLLMAAVADTSERVRRTVLQVWLLVFCYVHLALGVFGCSRPAAVCGPVLVLP
jgi:HEAT repeat protein